MARLTIDDRSPAARSGLPANLGLPLQVDARVEVGTLRWQGLSVMEATEVSGNYVFDSKLHRIDGGQAKVLSGNYQGSLSLDASAPLALTARLTGSLQAPVPGSGAVLPLAVAATVQGQLGGSDAAITVQAGLRTTAPAAGIAAPQAELVAQNIVALSEKTQAISDIILSVNDISERSHLLALNAAIEAAAAGESGRSFSVVASEMKVLADQAKDATNQVRAILGDVQRGINTSVMLTEEAVKRASAGKQRTETSQRTIGEITHRFQESVQTFQQIVASTNQQQLGIEQVMGALQNIRQASQQTAAGTRQLNDAAGNLNGLSEQLLALSGRYKI